MGILLSGSFQSAIELIGVLVIFVFVLILTWLTTKWMGNFQKTHTNNKNLNLVETIRVGNNKYVSIVKAGKKYFVVSAGKDEVNLIGEMNEEDLEDLSFKSESGTSTKDSFSKILSKLKGTSEDKLEKDEQD